MSNQISIISPVYKAEQIISELVNRILISASRVSDQIEIILVEDGSADHSWQMILKECQKDTRVKGIKLSRNFGQHNAIFAGLTYATGDWVVVMDCDLQDRPEEIINLYNKALEGFDIVLASRSVRNDPLFKRLFSFLFYKILSYLTDSTYNHQIANFGIYSKKAIQAALQLRESFKFFPLMINWVGFRYTSIPVMHSEREIGKTSYSFSKLIQLGTNVVLSYSEKLLRLTIKTGILISGMSFIISLYYLYAYLSGRIEVLGFASIIISLWFLGGLIITILGVIGLYIGKIFEGVKKRPFFIAEEKINV